MGDSSDSEGEIFSSSSAAEGRSTAYCYVEGGLHCALSTEQCAVCTLH